MAEKNYDPTDDVERASAILSGLTARLREPVLRGDKTEVRRILDTATADIRSIKRDMVQEERAIRDDAASVKHERRQSWGGLFPARDRANARLNRETTQAARDLLSIYAEGKAHLDDMLATIATSKRDIIAAMGAPATVEVEHEISLKGETGTVTCTCGFTAHAETEDEFYAVVDRHRENPAA